MLGPLYHGKDHAHWPKLDFMKTKLLALILLQNLCMDYSQISNLAGADFSETCRNDQYMSPTMCSLVNCRVELKFKMATHSEFLF